MNFGDALSALKSGEKVARSGWNGKNMFLFLVPGSRFTVKGAEISYHAHVDMKTAQGYVVPWLCSQTDMLSEDWEITK